MLVKLFDIEIGETRTGGSYAYNNVHILDYGNSFKAITDDNQILYAKTLKNICKKIDELLQNQRIH